MKAGNMKLNEGDGEKILGGIISRLYTDALLSV
jgi:hypothetical protein